MELVKRVHAKRTVCVILGILVVLPYIGFLFWEYSTQLLSQKAQMQLQLTQANTKIDKLETHIQSLEKRIIFSEKSTKHHRRNMQAEMDALSAKQDECIAAGKNKDLIDPITIVTANYKRQINYNWYYNSSNPKLTVEIVNTSTLIFEKDWYINLALTQAYLIDQYFLEYTMANDVLIAEDDIEMLPNFDPQDFYFYINYARTHKMGFLSLQHTGMCSYSHGMMLYFVTRDYFYRFLRPICMLKDSEVPVDICIHENLSNVRTVVTPIFTHNDKRKSTHNIFNEQERGQA